MRYLSLLVLFFVLLLTSCRNDFEFEPSNGGLTFSKNTVYLDTVFTNIGSSTYRLKVYNNSDKDISIPKVQLQKGVASKYRITVDGMTGDAGAQGKIFSNVELLAKDSLYIFIEVTADAASVNPVDFLYTDKIEFTNISSAPQYVDLVTLIQDAYFIYPERTQNSDNTFTYEQLDIDGNGTPDDIVGSTLSHTQNNDEYNWTLTKPYVVYGYALVPNGETLNIGPGTRVHFHANSGLIIAKDGRLVVNGGEPSGNDPLDVSNEVIFEGDRLEPDYSEVPGQWLAVINLSNRNDNLINHLTIKNATVGILNSPSNFTVASDIPKMTIKNSQIYNCSNLGMLSRGANINGENVVINYCGQASIACTLGGTYNFNHCTFNNDWVSTKQVAVLLSDHAKIVKTEYINDNGIKIFNFKNCIIYGTNNVEFLLDKKGTSNFSHKLENCLIKFNSSQLNNEPEYIFTNTAFYENCKIAINSILFNPKYKDNNKNKMWPTEDLFTIIPPLASAVGIEDITGKDRNTTNANVGAYQFIAN